MQKCMIKTIEITPVAMGDCNTARFNFAVKNKGQAQAFVKFVQEDLNIKAKTYEELEVELANAGICLWADDIFVNFILKELSK